MKKKNEVYRITYAGGLYGLLLGSTKGKLQAKIEEYNSRGWNLAFHMEDDPNLLLVIVKLIILTFTFGIWTLGSSQLLVFEKPNE